MPVEVGTLGGNRANAPSVADYYRKRANELAAGEEWAAKRCRRFQATTGLDPETTSAQYPKALEPTGQEKRAAGRGSR